MSVLIYGCEKHCSNVSVNLFLCALCRHLSPEEGREKKEATAYISCIELQQITCYDCVCVCVPAFWLRTETGASIELCGGEEYAIAR